MLNTNADRLTCGLSASADRILSVCLQLIVTYGRVMVAMLGILVISVASVALNHVETGYAQPYYHVDTGKSYQDVQKSFKPRHTEGDPSYAVEAEDTNRKPVKRTDDCQNKRDNRKNVESLFQNAFPPC